MVGGAPATQRWADRIGADAYAEDAAEAVTKALFHLKMKKGCRTSFPFYKGGDYWHMSPCHNVMNSTFQNTFKIFLHLTCESVNS